MPRQLHLEGPALEPLLEQARADHGASVTVVGAHRVRRGGFAGFFAREHYEVTVEVPDPTERPGTALATALATLERGASRPAETLEELLAMADRSDGAGALADARARAATAPVLGSPLPPRARVGYAPAPPATPDVWPAWEPPAPAGPTGDAASGPAATGPAATGSAATGSAATGSAGRVPGRTVSTESRAFDEVLAALRADLLGPGSTDALDRRYESSVDRLDLPAAGTVPAGALGETATDLDAPDVAAALSGADRLGPPEAPARPTATPWQPVTVLEDPEPAADLDRDLDLDLDAGPDLADRPAATAASSSSSPSSTLPASRPLLHPAVVGELVGLAVAVGADRASALAAAEDVAGSGAVQARHTLPLLAAALAERLPVLPGLVGGTADDGLDDAAAHAGAGEVVVVLGAPDRVDATAADVAALLGTPWLARWSDEPGARRAGGTTVLSRACALPALAGKARVAGLPLVLVIPDPSLADGVAPGLAGRGRSALLPALDPDLVVLVVDAHASSRRQRGVTDRVVAAHGALRPLVLALVGCGAAAAPLAHAGRPVSLLDGRPATGGTWTGVLLDALRAAAAR